MPKISRENFEDIFQSRISVESSDFIKSKNFNYEVASSLQFESGVIKYVNFLLGDKKESGPEYHEIWEKGWEENLHGYQKSGKLEELLPKFVRSNELIRFSGKWISPEDASFEKNFVTVLRDTMFRKYFGEVSSIWEFGCGTGLNLVHAASIFPEKELFGSDWAFSSIRILKEINERLGTKITPFHFDLFDPDIKLLPGSTTNAGLFTIGTMEQIGTDFDLFLEFVLTSNFKIIVHVETNYELYDKEILFDFLAKKYLEKRNWLRGYFGKLHELETSGRIRVLQERKTFGSFFHDRYTVTVWEKLDV
jgi:hypothetical protein